MAIGRDFTFDIKIIEQYKLFGQCVHIGRDFLREKAQIRIAIALLHITKNLVISPVLFDNVNAMGDWRWIALTRRDRILLRQSRFRATYSQRILRIHRAVGKHRPCHIGQLLWGRYRNRGQSALKQLTNVITRLAFVRIV